jgi:hypothetical protein
MHFIPTTQTQLDRIKVRAKTLRSQFERLGNARDAVAKEMGYMDYHHAVHCASLTAIQRSAPHLGQAADGDPVITLAIARLRDLLTGDAAVDLGNPRVRAAMQDFQGLRVASLLAKASWAENPQGFFDDAVDDFNAFGSEDFPPTVSNSGPAQRKQGFRLWAALMDDKHSATYQMLYAYAYLKVFGNYAAWIAQTPRNDAAFPVGDKLLTVMQQVMERRGVDETLDFLHGPADELMPLDMNVSTHTGSMDLEHASTWWSRIQAMVSVEMAGVCSILPFDLLAAQIASGATGKLPFALLYSPRSPEHRESFLEVAKLRWSTLTT